MVTVVDVDVCKMTGLLLEIPVIMKRRWRGLLARIDGVALLRVAHELSSPLAIYPSEVKRG